jgi:hypothetical protein
MIWLVLWPWRFDGQAEPERQTVRDEVLVTAEPGFYEPERSPSLLLASWFWFHHPGVAKSHHRRWAKWMQRRECGVDIGMPMTAKSSNRFRLPPQRRTPKIKSRDN